MQLKLHLHGTMLQVCSAAEFAVAQEGLLLWDLLKSHSLDEVSGDVTFHRN